MDADGGGTIGLEELENPLIGLGFAEWREDVQKLMNSVDKDGNGDIDFDEFWSIIKCSDRDEKERQIYEFFKQMANGSLKLGVSKDWRKRTNFAYRKRKRRKKTSPNTLIRLSILKIG